ncbi:hypothetical protein [Candidatus Contubernalis alkaliaceticus]|uniref:hypothetical protein n=1 Tax=Candidatus Contubernalis alkaliaceticus TaxID=338645 RepID=UPI001F4BF0FC|nr:hypothetical protein [Candidatus Contubernalis alkalaceticus]UNC92887.1 hypothetical protein HUE98_12740 [Candidatus Contubernalis alkalaceticus]
MSMEPLATITVLAFIVEFVTEIIKSIFPGLKEIGSKQAAAVIGMLICLVTQSGLLTLLNITVSFVYLDYLITGLIISRGSNVIHDLFKQFEKK